jgi:hypothetical protein
VETLGLVHCHCPPDGWLLTPCTLGIHSARKCATLRRSVYVGVNYRGRSIPGVENKYSLVHCLKAADWRWVGRDGHVRKQLSKQIALLFQGPTSRTHDARVGDFGVADDAGFVDVFRPGAMSSAVGCKVFSPGIPIDAGSCATWRQAAQA